MPQNTPQKTGVMFGRIVNLDSSCPKKYGTVHDGKPVDLKHDDRLVRKLGGESGEFPTSVSADRKVICARQSGGYSQRELLALALGKKKR